MEAAPEVERSNVPLDKFESQGRTTVKTPWGYTYQPRDPKFPIIGEAGVEVTMEEAETLVEESDGLLTIVRASEKNEEE